jgi:hypothetical protein
LEPLSEIVDLPVLEAPGITVRPPVGGLEVVVVGRRR